ncbi:MAG TPA: HEAT repeat domain-containing protein [Thermoanaerobaculia bacterium]|nr:HEAT repeat domain-containing protein [Thermoanaerobaculia bacterium]
MPLLMTESLDAIRREQTHEHIESCTLCEREWADYKETWAMLGDLPEVDVPARVKEKFLQRAGLAEPPATNVVPFHRRPSFKWIAQAAAVVIIAGGSYFLGDRNAERFTPTTATISGVTPIERISYAQTPLSIAESRVVDAREINPEIQGRPNITNVQCVDCDASDGEIGVSFDTTTRWTITGNPKEQSMVRLLSYMLENEEALTPRSNAMDWVRNTYSDPAYANPQIAEALAKVLRNDSQHEGVRIRAVDTLTNLPPQISTPTRDALIEALKSDPNPAVRLKAVEALANMARSGEELDADTVDTLRQKSLQDDENMYVRVKAAEALKNIKPR